MKKHDAIRSLILGIGILAIIAKIVYRWVQVYRDPKGFFNRRQKRYDDWKAKSKENEVFRVGAIHKRSSPLVEVDEESTCEETSDGWAGL
jgi:hypothetical protein